jgi:hypothetical protein
MLVDKVLEIVKNNLANNQVIISRDNFKHIWIELAANKKLFDKTKGLFGKEYSHVINSLNGLGFHVNYINSSFVIRVIK